MKHAFEIFLLLCPIGFAIWQDWDGDKHPNRDLVQIAIVGALASMTVGIIEAEHGREFFCTTFYAAVFSAAWFIGVFPYAINYILISRGIMNRRLKWYDHLSATAWPDKCWWWRGLPWWIRVVICLVIVIFGSVPYFKLIV